MKTKSQVAMEWLMNYGFLILAVIIAIGVLAYFGGFSPQNFIVDEFVISEEVCRDEENSLSESCKNGCGGLMKIIYLNKTIEDYTFGDGFYLDGEHLRVYNECHRFCDSRFPIKQVCNQVEVDEIEVCRLVPCGKCNVDDKGGEEFNKTHCVIIERSYSPQPIIEENETSILLGPSKVYESFSYYTKINNCTKVSKQDLTIELLDENCYEYDCVGDSELSTCCDYREDPSPCKNIEGTRKFECGDHTVTIK